MTDTTIKRKYDSVKVADLDDILNKFQAELKEIGEKKKNAKVVTAFRIKYEIKLERD